MGEDGVTPALQDSITPDGHDRIICSLWGNQINEL
jgi:hypothetical protein